MRLLRIIFSIVALFFLVCIIAITCLIIFIDPNKLKPIIVTEVMQKTGYQLVIDSNISWSLYPKPGIKTAHMQLKNPAQNTSFVDLYDISIATDFMELLHGNKKLQGDVYIKQIKFMSLQAEHAHIVLHWQDQVLTLQPFTASLYAGTMTGIAHGRILATIPSWDWNVQFKQIQIKPLLQDIYGKNNRLNLSGLGQVQLQGTTQGVTRNQVLSNLNGNGHFRVSNGVVEGIDFNYFVENANALINKQPLNNLTNTNRTVFDSLTGAMVIKNGIAETDNLFLISTAFSTKAFGQVDLLNQRLNFQLQIIPLHTGKIQWSVPLLIFGNIESPTIRLDMLKLQEIITQEQLEKIKNKVQEKVKELPQKVDKFLQKIMNK